MPKYPAIFIFRTKGFLNLRLLWNMSSFNTNQKLKIDCKKNLIIDLSSSLKYPSVTCRYLYQKFYTSPTAWGTISWRFLGKLDPGNPHQGSIPFNVWLKMKVLISEFSCRTNLSALFLSNSRSRNKTTHSLCFEMQYLGFPLGHSIYVVSIPRSRKYRIFFGIKILELIRLNIDIFEIFIALEFWLFQKKKFFFDRFDRIEFDRRNHPSRFWMS
jgi:hypothetical protein